MFGNLYRVRCLCQERGAMIFDVQLDPKALPVEGQQSAVVAKPDGPIPAHVIGSRLFRNAFILPLLLGCVSDVAIPVPMINFVWLNGFG